MAMIYVIEDNPAVIKMVRKQLAKWQYQVVAVKDWDHLDDEIDILQPDLILCDITLPTFDGFYWMQQARHLTSAPIIVISAADIDSNIMHAVAAGADDYLMKPFSATVLVAKVQALLRRNQQKSDDEQLQWGDNHFNHLTNELSNNAGTVQLTPTEGALIAVLADHHGKTVTKHQLLEWLWQGGKYLNDNTLNVNISRLRRKLETIDLGNAIRTERGVGYRLVVDNE
ncbi:response regulator transcription factor [Limosilactobacillus sp.]|uniref:response regulator transcription factor n=1 Tax=Limosilactobacillus sp. TaxID=2773925 RepID=UPI00345EE76C